ncbi:hypothetical protein P3S72_28015 [Pseudomonas sp. D3]|uniref:hypothetical protein n=1 Tax=Pseudomonas sp. D3 TaxID=517398 RepID=UPI0023E3D03B|nr:hypothetical protein [Pseudomonas sp. D3]WET10267.1 hypothetical protein P3S72_28015 [Pseudomonas sp. D3]
MIGLIPNLFSGFDLFSAQQKHTPADIDQCPAPSNIQSKAYTDPALPPPYGEGYQYTANANGKTWSGQTAGTNDDYLDSEYALKAEAINERDDKVHCDYGAKRLIKNGEGVDPHLRLTTLK